MQYALNLFKTPVTLLLSRQTKTPAATENSRFIIKPAVHKFKNSLFDFSLQVWGPGPVRRYQNTFYFWRLLQKKSWQKINKYYTCTHFDQENAISTKKTNFYYWYIPLTPLSALCTAATHRVWQHTLFTVLLSWSCIGCRWNAARTSTYYVWRLRLTLRLRRPRKEVARSSEQHTFP